MVVRRTALSIVFAALVPLAVFGVLQIAGALTQQRANLEAQAVSSARYVNSKIDGRLQGDLGALSVLASSQFIDGKDWVGASKRAMSVAVARPMWAHITLLDAVDGSPVFSVAPHDATDDAGSAMPLALLAQPGAAQVGDLDVDLSPCLCVELRQSIVKDGRLAYLLIVNRQIDDLQEALLESVRPPEVAAVVDRQGNFLARTVEYEHRIGTPATSFVRDAVARGGNGLYTGVTYEGLKNRTAYVVSDLSGWSTHIAVPAEQFSRLELGSVGFTIFAGLVALGFSATLGWIGVRRIAAQRRVEQARLQSQKLQAIGQVASSVAHDFNNLLAINAAVYRQLKRRITGAAELELIEQGEAASNRGAELIKQISSFSRSKPLKLECIDLQSCTQQIYALLRQALGKGILLTINISDNAQYVLTNGAQLELALLNLAVNARDAMPDGGTLEISSRKPSHRDGVDLVIRDNGSGMSAETLARATEPFFTTKPDGKGTGLGLAQVHALASHSGGQFNIESAPDVGTTFTLHFQACKPS